MRFPLVLGRLGVARCVLDEQVRNKCRSKLLDIQCVNRFELLVSQICDNDELMECLSGDEHVHSGLDVQLVGDRVRALGGSDRRLRIATWNFSGLGIVGINKRKLGSIR